MTQPEPWIPDQIWAAAVHAAGLDPDAPLYIAVDEHPDAGDNPAIVLAQRLPDQRITLL